jgi:hypothetical protein
MSHETSPGSRESASPRRRAQDGGVEQSPLQTRARFLENWDWLSVSNLNRRLCEGRGAQHGPNPESHETCRKEWEKLQKEELTLFEVLAQLRRFHRLAPFLFFNGNSFAELGRGLTYAVFAEVSTLRRKQIASLVAHFIAGLPDVDETTLKAALRDLVQMEQFKIGDSVTTLKKSLTGKIVRINEDGTLVWKCDQTGSLMTATPQSLLLLPKRA